MKKVLIFLLLFLIISCSTQVDEDRFEKTIIHPEVYIMIDTKTGREFLVYPEAYSIIIFGKVIVGLGL